MDKELTWKEYAPLYAPHVKGRYTERTYDQENGNKPEPQKVEVHCENCGKRYKAECLQGQPRQHIARFANIHLHRNPMNQGTPQRVPR